MDAKTAQILNRMTGAFYRTCADSFSRTRRGAWAGWTRALEGPAGAVFAGDDTVSVLDVACGNGRFEQYLQRRYPNRDLEVYAVDNCAPLVGAPSSRYRELDVLDALLAGTLERDLSFGSCDLVVCFGYFHHVPGWENRVRLLRTLADVVRPGGFAIVSFWQFLNSPELAQRAHMAHERGVWKLAASGADPSQLEIGDYLLGWQDTADVFRYCHSFTVAEVEQLAAEAGLKPRVVECFEADGRTRDLNAYLVLRG